jgi:Domain of unknown function (DU1801)
MQSKATSVAGYLAELPPDRRAALEAVRQVILRNLDKDYQEGMGYGMIGYSVPHRVYPAGYHCDPSKPLPFAGLASQKNHMSIYMMSAYGDRTEYAWLASEFKKAGKKLDMGQCCIRFKTLDDLPLDVIGEAIRRVPTRAYIERYEKALAGMGKKNARSPTKKAPENAARKPTKRTTTKASRASARAKRGS